MLAASAQPATTVTCVLGMPKMTAPEAFTSKLGRSQKKFLLRCVQYLTRMYFTIKKLGVAGLVGVPVTSEVAFFASPFLVNYFLRQGMMHALSNCCQL